MRRARSASLHGGGSPRGSARRSRFDCAGRNASRLLAARAPGSVKIVTSIPTSRTIVRPDPAGESSDPIYSGHEKVRRCDDGARSRWPRWVRLPPPVSAQWPAYRAAGTPKTADGKPNLDAPAPRTADGKPDFTGIWNNAFFGVPPAPLAAAGRTRRPQTARPAGKPHQLLQPALRPPPVAVAALRPSRCPPTARRRSRRSSTSAPDFPTACRSSRGRKSRLDERRADNDKDNPDAHCLPMGLLQFHEHIQPRKIVQTKDVIVIIYEANYGTAPDLHDGRALPRQRSDAVVVWLQRRPLGGRHAGRRNRRPARRRLARHLGQPADRQGEDHRAVQPPEVRPDEYRRHDRRPEGLHEAVHRALRRSAWRASDELIEFICNENERSDAHLVGK